jgi:hypothetical protein
LHHGGRQRQAQQVLIRRPLAAVIGAACVGIRPQGRHLQHPAHARLHGRLEQGLRPAHVQCLEGLLARFAQNAGRIDDRVHALQPG